MRNAKIVCTLGPASGDRSTIRALAGAGMSVARLNASHGSRERRRAILDRVQDVDDASGRPLASMVDLQGPEVRTVATDDPVDLEAGTTVRFVEGVPTDGTVVGVSHPLEPVAEGDRVLLDDGRIETVVTGREEDAVLARVEAGGELPGRSGINVPGVDLDLPVPTDADRATLELAAEVGVDFVAASFVRDAQDVYAIETVLESHDTEIPVVAKIEREVALGNLEEILEAAYGVMVARGDLGVECPMEEVPVIQKRIIRECGRAGVPVITATEMLDSMVHERRPTRAEASDVANAVLDGTDAVMLSAETAVGDHPVAVVEAMDRIVREVEGSEEYRELREQRVPTAGETRTDALARSARYLARDVGATAVVAITESGYTALKTAKFRPTVPVVAATPTDGVRRQLALSWGTTPQYVSLEDRDLADLLEGAVGTAIEAGVAESGDTVVVLSGMMSDLEAGTAADMLKVHVAAETVGAGRGVVAGRAVGPLARAPTGNLEDVPDGAILALDAGFDAEFRGDATNLGGIVAADPGMTGYAAVVAREVGVPMVSGVPLALETGRTVTVDGERGVVYEGAVGRVVDEPVGR